MRVFSSLKYAPLALLVTTFAANAADMPQRPVYKAPVVLPESVSWAGFYVGGNIGGKWGDFSSPITIAATPTTAAGTQPFSGHDSSFIGGIQVGYNWQFNQWVVGIEGDWDAQSLRRRLTLGAAAACGLFCPGDSFEGKSDWQGSVRLRTGYAWGSWLAYVTGGVALTDVRVRTNFLAVAGLPASVASSSRTLTGGTIGGGLEYALSRNLSIGVEGRYTDYGSSNAGLGTVAVLPGPPLVFAPVSSRVDMNTFEVTGRLNWRFDWGAPVVARY